MTRSLTTLTLALALTPLLPIDAEAAAFRYDGLEIGYARTPVVSDVAGDLDLNSYSIEAMYSLTPSLVIGGSYIRTTASSATLNADGSTPALEFNGVGPVAFGFLHHAVTANTDVLLGASHTTHDTEITRTDRPAEDVSTTHSQTEALAGVRQRLFGKLELGALLRYDIDAASQRDAVNYTVSTRLVLDTSMDLAAYYTPNDSGDEIKVSLKKYFGKPRR